VEREVSEYLGGEFSLYPLKTGCDGSHFQISVFVWPFLQTVNFKYVPPRLRPIYVGVFSFFWTTGLAALKHKDTGPDVIKHFLNK